MLRQGQLLILSAFVAQVFLFKILLVGLGTLAHTCNPSTLVEITVVIYCSPEPSSPTYVARKYATPAQTWRGLLEWAEESLDLEIHPLNSSS